jgi:hypothetical protein
MEAKMVKTERKIAINICVVIFLIIAVFHVPAAHVNAETLQTSSLFYRITLGFSVDNKKVQEWLTAPWKAVSISKGILRGSNIFVLFDDWFIRQDAEGKLDKDGAFCSSAIVAFGKNEQKEEFSSFVTRMLCPYDDPGPYKNAVKAAVNREATLKSVTSATGSGSELWTINDNNGGILEFRMEYQRAVLKRSKIEPKVRSNVDPDFYRIYRFCRASYLVLSVPEGINRVKNYQLKTNIPELSKIFDGSEQLIAITIFPSIVRQAFLP